MPWQELKSDRDSEEEENLRVLAAFQCLCVALMSHTPNVPEGVSRRRQIVRVPRQDFIKAAQYRGALLELAKMYMSAVIDAETRRRILRHADLDESYRTSGVSAKARGERHGQSLGMKSLPDVISPPAGGCAS